MSSKSGRQHEQPHNRFAVDFLTIF
jgi:hypothetical protein